MDYETLTRGLMHSLWQLQRCKPHDHMTGFLRGGGFILQYVTQHDRAQPGDISAEMGISAARVTAALRNLEGKGLLRRRVDEEDRRCVLIEPTEAGRAIAEAQRRKVEANTAEILRSLGDADARELLRLLERLAALCAARPPCHPECGECEHD